MSDVTRTGLPALPPTDPPTEPITWGLTVRGPRGRSDADLSRPGLSFVLEFAEERALHALSASAFDAELRARGVLRAMALEVSFACAPLEQAALLLGTLDEGLSDLPPVLVVHEVGPNSALFLAHLHQIIDLVACCHGRLPLLMTGRDVWRSGLDDDASCAHLDLWLDGREMPSPWTRARFARPEGERHVFSGSRPELADYARGTKGQEQP